MKKNQIQTEIDLELRKEILADQFEKKSSVMKFFYSHIPPFSTAQREADKDSCNKSFIAAMLFNQRNLSTGVSPISFDKDEIPSCKRIQKR